MKIVGLLSDEDEIYEMELTAKIFVVEQRMKNLKYGGKTNVIPERKCITSSEETKICHDDMRKRLPILTVRGLT